MNQVTSEDTDPSPNQPGNFFLGEALPSLQLSPACDLISRMGVIQLHNSVTGIFQENANLRNEVIKLIQNTISKDILPFIYRYAGSFPSKCHVLIACDKDSNDYKNGHVSIQLQVTCRDGLQQLPDSLIKQCSIRSYERFSMAYQQILQCYLPDYIKNASEFSEMGCEFTWENVWIDVTQPTVLFRNLWSEKSVGEIFNIFRVPDMVMNKIIQPRFNEIEAIFNDIVLFSMLPALEQSSSELPEVISADISCFTQEQAMNKDREDTDRFSVVFHGMTGNLHTSLKSFIKDECFKVLQVRFRDYFDSEIMPEIHKLPADIQDAFHGIRIQAQRGIRVRR